MKKIYFFGAVAAAALALTTGCSKNELVNETPSDAKAISFRVNGDAPEARPNGPQRTTGTTLAYVNAFAVWGVDSIKGTAGSAVTVFDGVSVVRQVTGSNVFDYNPKRMYSQGADTASFFAYSPISTFVTAPELVGQEKFKFSYTVPKPNATGNSTQEDLLVASSFVTPSASSVPLNFTHALSRIFVTATNTSPLDVYVKSLTLKNIYEAGDFTYPLAAGDTVGWAVTGTQTDFQYVLADSGMVVKTGTLAGTKPTLVTSKEQGMMIIPQQTANTSSTQTTLAANDFALKVVYDMGNLKNQVAYILLKDEFAFKPNSQYVINIAFTGTAITFTVTVTDFIDDVVVYP